MVASTGATVPQARLNERTRESVLKRMGLYAAAACGGALCFGVGAGPGWVIPSWCIVFVIGWLVQLLATSEWTFAGRELRRRRWLSRPGAKPSTVMELGPQVEIAHEGWGRWLVLPHGPSVDVQPWQTSLFVDSMKGAGARVNDWRGEWSRRHRLVNTFGLVVYYGGAAGIFVAVALGGLLRPVGSIVYWVALGGLFLGTAIDFLPWRIGGPKPSTRDA